MNNSIDEILNGENMIARWTEQTENHNGADTTAPRIPVEHRTRVLYAVRVFRAKLNERYNFPLLLSQREILILSMMLYGVRVFDANDEQTGSERMLNKEDRQWGASKIDIINRHLERRAKKKQHAVIQYRAKID